MENNKIIIIPKEEPKQGTISEAIKKVINNQLIQEPLEEVAKNNAVDNWLCGYNHLNLSDFDKNSIAVDFGNGWDMAIEWQQKQGKNKYSEEEVHKIVGSYEAHKLSFGIKFTYNNWFEQFKKK